MKIDSEKKYLWHLTSEPIELDSKNRTFLKPMCGYNRTQIEPKGKRICVSTIPEGCFVAIPFERNYEFQLYRSVNKLVSRIPYGVHDAEITCERWLSEKKLFELVLTLTPDEKYFKNSFKEIENPNIHEKIMKILRANHFYMGSDDEMDRIDQRICRNLIAELPEIKMLKEMK